MPFIFVLQVHDRKSDGGDHYVYETELLGPIAHSVYDQIFFKCLDAQLNKVNNFYELKENEFLQRAAILDKQICALSGVKKLLEQGRIRQYEDGASGRQSELGKCGIILIFYKCARAMHVLFDLKETHTCLTDKIMLV